MNLVDLAIVVVIGLGILIGWKNGLIGPLLAEGTFLLSYWIVATHPSLVGIIPAGVPRPLAMLLLPVELGQLAAVSSLHPVALAQLGQYAQVINYYENTLRPQLATSRLAPLVIKYGARLPIIGRHVTLPQPH